MRYLFLPLFLVCLLVADARKPKAKMKDMYFMSAEGERIESISSDEKVVYLVIEGTNLRGKKASITLEEDGNKADSFVYKRKFMTGGDRIKFRLKKDRELFPFFLYNAKDRKHIRYKRRWIRKQERIKRKEEKALKKESMEK